MKSFIAAFISISIFLLSCNKNQGNIDVSEQWNVDYNGNLIQSPPDGVNDGQWAPKVFTSQEQNLFAGLDTADLTGTVAPDSVFHCSSIIPNPFTTEAFFLFSFSSGFNGQIEFKYVIVDDHMNAKDQGAIRIQATNNPNLPSNPSGGSTTPFSPDIPVGKYRIYFMLSAATGKVFYSSWGNIQKAQ